MQEIPVYRGIMARIPKFPLELSWRGEKQNGRSNYIDLLWLARRRFAENAAGPVRIFIGPSHIRRRILPERTRDCSAA